MPRQSRSPERLKSAGLSYAQAGRSVRKLLEHLINRLDPGAAHLPLNLHTCTHSFATAAAAPAEPYELP